MGNFTNSYQYVHGIKSVKEDGISVFEGIKHRNKFFVILPGSKIRSSYDELYHQDNDIYWVDGDWINSEGADGENLLDTKTFKVIRKLNKEDVKIWGD